MFFFRLRILSSVIECFDVRLSGFFLLLSWICNVASLILITISLYRCAGQCILFGEIFEVRRHMDGGSRMWCFVSALLCVVCFLADTLAIKLRLQERKWMRSMFFTGMCAGCLAAIIVSIGFKSWCGSFTINSCWYNNKQDWHFFTPKFSDCYGAFYWFLAITICLWFSLLLKSLVLFCYKWNRRIVMTTSS